MNSPQPIAYIVSMTSGLDAFVYREVEELTSMGIPIVLYATKFKKGDVLSPKPEWPNYHLPLWALFFLLPLRTSFLFFLFTA